MFWMFVISARFPGAERSRGPYFSPLCNVPLIFASLFFLFATLFVCRSSRPADSSGLPPTLCFVPAHSEKRVFGSTSCSLAAHLPSFYCLSLRREPCSGTNRLALQCFPSSSRHCWWVFFEFFFFKSDAMSFLFMLLAVHSFSYTSCIIISLQFRRYFLQRFIIMLTLSFSGFLLLVDYHLSTRVQNEMAPFLVRVWLDSCNV